MKVVQLLGRLRDNGSVSSVLARRNADNHTPAMLAALYGHVNILDLMYCLTGITHLNAIGPGGHNLVRDLIMFLLPRLVFFSTLNVWLFLSCSAYLGIHYGAKRSGAVLSTKA